jgi:phage baseplate assembly protein gpV
MAGNGNSEERMHLSTSMLVRPTLVSGEVCMFHPDTGSIVRMDSNGNITMTAPEITINGNLTVTGTIDATDEITSGSITMTGHRHTITGGSSAGITSTGSG